MSWLRVSAIIISLLIHASLGYAMLPKLQEAQTDDVVDAGKGTDIVLVEQGIADAGQSSGEAMQTMEAPEIAAAQPPPPPPEAVKPDELRDVISSEASTVEQQVVKAEDPPPPVDKPPPPELVQTKAIPEQVAVVTEQSSGEAKTGGNAKIFGLYMGQINEHVQKAKINPRSSVAGTVIMRFTIGTDGKLLSKEIQTSSGSKMLDDAATAALDRAAPFPPIPPEVSLKPLAFTQPFRFVIR